MTTPEQFLKAAGIELNVTALFSVIDGYVRQPDLRSLLNGYAELRMKESFVVSDKDAGKTLDVEVSPREYGPKEPCCPKCKSKNIYHENGLGGSECEDCKHIW